MWEYNYIKSSDELYHHGIKGQRWGVRRFQDKSGRLTNVGKNRYTDNGDKNKKTEKSNPSSNRKQTVEQMNAKILKNNPTAAVVNHAAAKKYSNKLKEQDEDAEARHRRNKKIAIGIGVGVTVAAAGIIYLKNKDKIDTTVKNFLNKNGDKKSSVLLSNEDIRKYKKLGFDVKTKSDETQLNLVGGFVGHDIHRYDPISKDVYDSFDDVDLSLKPGQVFARITHSSGGKIHDGAYVSYDQDDINRYTAFMPALWKINSFGMDTYTDKYSVTMKAVTEIKVPSKKKRIDFFSELIKESPKLVTEEFVVFDEKFREDVKGNSDECARKYYNALAVKLIDRNSRLADAYKNKVVKAGYNALIDDNDAGRLSRNPLILLDHNTVSVETIKKLTNKTIREAAESIEPMDGESYDNTKQVISDVMLGESYINAYYNAMKGR